MTRGSDVRYIVVAIQDGIWYTLRCNNKIYWTFGGTRQFKRSGWAINAANNVRKRYIVDRVCVFKVRVSETLSHDNYREWLKDNDRLVL